MDNDFASLRAEMDTLTARVAALETSSSARPPHPPPDDDDALWALTGLRARLTDNPSTEEGAVMLVGALTLPTGVPVTWQQGAGTADLVDTEWPNLADTFAALGNPVRLELLRHILSGVHATADLAAIDSLGTTGQLHHHLRQLVAAGWVRHTGRGAYEVPAARVVPLLACVVGAER